MTCSRNTGSGSQWKIRPLHMRKIQDGQNPIRVTELAQEAKRLARNHKTGFRYRTKGHSRLCASFITRDIESPTNGNPETRPLADQT
jgi:hypothetical protein